jgi:hypothetical protein
MMKCIVFGHEWELGLCKVLENNQDFFFCLCIDAPWMCNF